LGDGAESVVSTEIPWWDVAFSDHYRTLYAHRTDAAARDEVAGLLPRLRVAPGPVLDLGCGHGRHLAALHAAGIPALGLDYSFDLLREAAQRSSCRGRVLRGDMRCPPFVSGWGAVLMLFTAFGYFDDDANRDCLAAWARQLAPGGWLLVDLPDVDHLAATLVPASERRCEMGVLRERRRLVGARVEKDVEIIPDVGGASIRYTESVRLYRRDEFAALATSFGLRFDACWSSLRGPEVDDKRSVWWLKR
jgi:SAM-dependent methyltransferase